MDKKNKDPTKLDVNMDSSLLSVTSKTSIDLVLHAKEKAEIWSEELCLKFIKDFESHSVLWNPLDPFFYKQTMKHDAWQEVALAVGKSAEACKYKMGVLMSSFRREKVKMMRYNHTGKAKKQFKSKWYAFDSMSFMLTKKQRVSEDIVVTQPVHKYTRSGSRRLQKRQHTGEWIIPELEIKTEVEHTDVDIQPACSSTKDTTCTTTCHNKDREEEDEIRAFTNFVAAKMRKYSTNTRSIVQREIGDILFHADQNHFVD